MARSDPFDWGRSVLSSPIGLLVVVAVSATNSIAEEWLFRAAILGGLIRSGMRPILAVTISSLSFGAAHFGNGLPDGLSGLVLATAFGLLQGAVYITQEDPRPFVLASHFGADVIILNQILLHS